MIPTIRRSLAVGFATLVLTLPAAAQDATSRSHEQRRDEWQKVDDIFKSMLVGFFTTRLSKAVGAQGRVFAVDISADALGRLRSRVAGDGLANVEVVEGAVDDPRLAPGTLDAVLIVNAYHEMTQHSDCSRGSRPR
ncbi:MAG: class I SAM-dependent methyltransferase [Acidobacteria bacterium]|nr:class I SAM-dependent methyltransferase [Acidobacteriota bacterium]